MHSYAPTPLCRARLAGLQVTDEPHRPRLVAYWLEPLGKGREGKEPPSARPVLEDHDNDEKKDNTKTETVLVSIN